MSIGGWAGRFVKMYFTQAALQRRLGLFISAAAGYFDALVVDGLAVTDSDRGPPDWVHA